MSKNTDKTDLRAVAGKALQPLIEHCAANRGAMAQVVRRYNELTGTDTKRQAIERHLHPDPDKRTEPRLGAGLILMQIKEEIA